MSNQETKQRRPRRESPAWIDHVAKVPATAAFLCGVFFSYRWEHVQYMEAPWAGALLYGLFFMILTGVASIKILEEVFNARRDAVDTSGRPTFWIMVLTILLVLIGALTLAFQQKWL